MAEQQLVDYIKKAKEAGQSDEQSRALLIKNGWSEAEVSEAFAAINPPQQVQPQAQPRVQPQPRPQAQIVSQPKADVQPRVDVQPQVDSRPQIKPQPQVQAQPQPQPQIQQQPAQYQPQPAAVSPVSNMPRTRSHFILKLVIVLIILVVVCGAGVFAAGQYLNLPWNPFWPNPAMVMSKMMVNMQNVKVYHTTTQGDISLTGAYPGKLSFNFDSKNDITDTANPKADGSFNIDLTSPELGSSSNSIQVKAIIVGGAAYVNLVSLVVPGLPASSTMNLSQAEGKWFKIDQDSIKALSRADAAQITIPSVTPSGSSDLTKKIQQLVASEDMFSVSKQLADETINGHSTYHYLVVISKEKLEDFTNKIITLSMQEASSSQAQGSTIDTLNSPLMQNMVQAAAKTIVDAVGDVNIEMWIGKGDSMLYEAKLDKTVDLSKIVAAVGATVPGANIQIEFKTDTLNSDFNQPVSIQAPAGSQKIEDFILPMMKNQAAESDMGQISFTAQSIFVANKSYYLLCKNGFLNGGKATIYGPSLTSAVNSLIKQGAKNPICFGDSQDYCVSTQLTDGSYLCADKSGGVGKVKCTSSKTSCE